MEIRATRQSAESLDSIAQAAAGAQSLEDLAALLRALRRRHARTHRDSNLTYRELAARTGWSHAGIAAYFTAGALAPTDRFDALLGVLGAGPTELRPLAEARDRVEENQRRAKARRPPPAAPAAAPNRGSERPGTARGLPPDTVLFTGRDRELGRLLALVEPSGAGRGPGASVISAIDGMGGVGKTALAIRAGHRLAEHFPDGQLFLDLHGFSRDGAPREPGDALAALLATLGVAPGQIPQDVDVRAALYRERLAATRTLLLLDNAADEAQVRPLLPAAEGCLVLITSRRRLKALDDAVPVSLDTLGPGEAVALLRRSARADEESQGDAGWVRVAELCGYLPLALVIAGAVLRTGGRAWTLQRLIERLAARRVGRELAGYADGERDVAAVFDLSYRHLDEEGRLLFRRLGVLPGPEIDAYGAAALLGTDPGEADLLVQHLADHSLLTAADPGRYRLHDLLRAHAGTLAASLDAEDDRAAARERLLDYYAHTAQTASRSLARHPRPAPRSAPSAAAPDLADPDAARAWLRAERLNLDAAFTWVSSRVPPKHTHIIALAAGLGGILDADGPWSRALQVHRAAARSAEHLALSAPHADALFHIGGLTYLTGDYAEAVDACTRALEIYRQLDDRLGEANTLIELGRVRQVTGDHTGALETDTRALELYRELGDRLGEADALIGLGRVRQVVGDRAGTLEADTRALEIYRELGDRLGEANALIELGRVRQLAGDLSGALEADTGALELYRMLRHRLGEPNALLQSGQVRRLTGDVPRAVEDLSRALELYRAIGNRFGEAFALLELGGARRAAGDVSGAGEALDGALERYRVLGSRPGEATVLSALGQVRRLTGDHAGAVEAHTQALKTYRALGHRGSEASALNHFAATLAAMGERARAHELYRQALALNRELDKPDDEAISLEGIGDYHLAEGDTVHGAARLHQALEIYRRLGMRADVERLHARLESLDRLAVPDTPA